MSRETKMVKNPYKYKYLRVMNPRIGEQNEFFYQRMNRYMITNEMTIQDFVDFVNKKTGKHDAKLTYQDVYGYSKYRISPKADKLYSIVKATKIRPEYFCGYGPNTL